MREHGALGNTGGAAGVLQKSNVVLGDVDWGERNVFSSIKCLTQWHGPLNAPVRHHVLNVLDDLSLIHI